jgi:hypothetical protein
MSADLHIMPIPRGQELMHQRSEEYLLLLKWRCHTRVVSRKIMTPAFLSGALLLSTFLSYTCSSDYSILSLSDPFIPFLIIILIDPRDLAILVDFNNHTHVTSKVLPAGLNRDLTVGPNNVVTAPPNPHLL